MATKKRKPQKPKTWVYDRLTGKRRNKDHSAVARGKKAASKTRGKKRSKATIAKARAALIKTLQTGKTVWNRRLAGNRKANPRAGTAKHR